jgi:thiosulfate reductase/polysulfide reductase chain A
MLQTAERTVIKRGNCPVCGTGCHAEVRVADGRAVKVKADRKSLLPADCPRAGAALEYHEHPDRLNVPLKRTGRRGEGRWARISWGQAIDEIAARLGRIREQYGPEAVFAVGGSIKGPGDAAMWRWCNLWGTPNYLHQGKNCGEPEFLAEWAVYGDITPYASPRAGLTKCAVLWGSNRPRAEPRRSRPFFEAQKQGTKLIVVDPRKTDAAARADVWLQLRPGTDGALAYGLLNVIINEGLYDHEFVDRWCLGFEQLRAVAQKYDPDTVAAITWVPRELIVAAARLYATHKPGVMTTGLGHVELGPATNSAVIARCALRAITGNLDVLGGQMLDDEPTFTAYREELHWDRLIDHPRRTRDSVSADRWPVASVRGLKMFREAMQRVHPKGVGPASYMIYPSVSSVWSAILDEQPYPIKAVLTQGTNALVAFANSRRVYRALKSEKLDLHVVMDHWMTPGAQLADYVLPASDGLERPNLTGMWGFGNMYGAACRAVSPHHERRDDYQLWRELGGKLDQQGEWPETLEGWFDQLLRPSNVTFADLTARDSAWLVPTPQAKRYEQTGFATFSGKVELASSLLERLGYNPLPEYQEPPWSPVSTPELAREYPLVLTTGGSSPFFYRSQQRQLRRMRRQHPCAMVQIHPETAQRLGLADGDWAHIETPMGKVKQQVRICEGIDPRVVHADGLWWYPEQPGEEPSLFGVWESNINAIIPDDADRCDFAGDQNLRGLLCRISPATV